ncbi:Glyoxalase [Aeromicrobium sp. 9AM]|nr:Glyoxalase [Aeromicrobium sp. 9AM]
MRAMTSPRHHRIDYVELAATDLARLKQFYADAFGWAFNDYGPDYAGIQGRTPEDPEVGGLNPESKPSRGGVFVQLYSDDLDATAEAIRSAGGEIVDGPYGFPGGRRLHFVDPSGNELGVWSEQQ